MPALRVERRVLIRRQYSRDSIYLAVRTTKCSRTSTLLLRYFLLHKCLRTGSFISLMPELIRTIREYTTVVV